MATKTIFWTTVGTKTIPTDFNSDGPWTIHAIGGGAGGGASRTRGGGGGGAYAAITNSDATITAGQSVYTSLGTTVPSSGSAGVDSWVNLSNAASAPTIASNGVLAKGGATTTTSTGASGGLA